MSDFTKEELQEIHSALCDRHADIEGFLSPQPLRDKIKNMLSNHHEQPTVAELREKYRVAPSRI